MHLFYIPEVSGAICRLNEEESKHCVRVLRLKENDSIEITDGKGNLYHAVIEEANPKSCLFRITEHYDEPFIKPELIIAVAPTKNLARMEWLIEKLTEIGITRFIPMECHNSERKVLKTERLKKIAVEAMKQSGRVYLPQIDEIISFDKLLKNYDTFKGQKMIAHCNSVGSGQWIVGSNPEMNSGQVLERKTLSDVYNKGENALILIGPEGDFTGEEIEQALAKGFIRVTLNEKTLRTETAALVVVCEVNSLNTSLNNNIS